jgi:hypothetical protein
MAGSTQGGDPRDGEIRLWKEDGWWIAKDTETGVTTQGGSRTTALENLDVKHRVIDEDEDPHVVAGEYELSMADLFRALAYYYDSRETLKHREQADTARRQQGEQRTRERMEEVDLGANAG